jgi:hypothetical protein
MLDSNTLIWGMLDSCGMNCENYSSTIAGWSSSPTCPSGLQLGANSLHYGSNVQTYRDNLINTKGWMIFGDSMNVIPCCFTLFNTLNVNTCNSYFFNGQTLTSSGVYYDTLSNAYGCDSLITLNLTINNVSQSVINQTACNSYFFNGQTLTSSGTYYDTLLNANGCDSLITLNLTINNVNILISQAGPNLNANATGATYQWLTCPSYSPIIGDNMQNFIASTNGDYAVEVTVNGCTDTSACYTVIGIGIQEINNASSFSVYPNPVSNTLYIQSSTAFTDKKKEFYNAFGQILFTTKNNVIDVSTYSKGIYYLKCEHQVVKVVVE